MYEIHLFTAVSLLLISWYNFRNLLHPHFVFVSILVVMFMSDYLVRGYEDKNIDLIIHTDLIYYQIVVLCVVCWMALLSLIIEKNIHPQSSLEIELNFNKRDVKYLIIFSWLIIILEIIKRLYTTDWSFSGALEQSLAARGSQPWTTSLGNLGDHTFIFYLNRHLLPFSGLMFSYFIAQGKGYIRIVFVIGFALAMALLVTEGSRTPVLLSFATLAYFFIKQKMSFVRKIVILLPIAALAISIVSMMYLYRSQGLVNIMNSDDNDGVRIVYHQDDSYYRALRAMSYSDSTNERWDPVDFFYTTIVNPIPRFFWKNKPALTEKYWGGYKDYWVTITFLGEFVAMYGVLFGSILTVFVGLACYFVISRVSKSLSIQGGVIIYFIAALYVYMIMRSMLNITQFIYLPIFSLFLFYINNRYAYRLKTG